MPGRNWDPKIHSEESLLSSFLTSCDWMSFHGVHSGLRSVWGNRERMAGSSSIFQGRCAFCRKLYKWVQENWLEAVELDDQASKIRYERTLGWSHYFSLVFTRIILRTHKHNFLVVLLLAFFFTKCFKMLSKCIANLSHETLHSSFFMCHRWWRNWELSSVKPYRSCQPKFGHFG